MEPVGSIANVYIDKGDSAVAPSFTSVALLDKPATVEPCIDAM